MTPPAATVAGRATEPVRAPAPTRNRPRPSGGLADPPRSTARPADPAHRRTVRPAGPAPRHPRRISGPFRGAVALPGRVTSPARKPAPRRAPAPTRPRQPPAVAAPLGARVLAHVRALPDHRWLDRLVRGRAWIPLLGVLLVGIVAIQVEVLKLGASIGRSMTLATQLQSRNQLLKTSVSELSSGQRIMREAGKLGMYLPGPTEVNFVPARSRGAMGKAIRGLRSPDPQTFLAALAAQVSADGVTNPALGSSGTGLAAAAAPTATNSAALGSTPPTTTTTPTTTSTPTTSATTTTTTPTTPATTSTPTTLAPAGTSPTTSSSTGGVAAG